VLAFDVMGARAFARTALRTLTRRFPLASFSGAANVD
jgi:hypothetical protein